MNFLKQIKTHLFYLLSKRNIILLVILNSLVIFLLIISSQLFKGISYIDEYRRETLEQYRQSSFILIKVCILFVFFFVNMSYFSGLSSKYSQYFIKDKKTKITFYLSKYLSIFIFDSFEYIFLYFNYELIKILLPYNAYPLQDFKLYFSLYLMGVYYIFLSSLLLIITDSYFSLVVPIIMFWSSDILIDSITNSTILNKAILALTVSVSYENVLPFGILHAFLMILIMIELNIVVIKKKDTL